MPYNLQEFKDHSRIIGTDDDASVLAYMLAAIANAEAYTWRPIGKQVWKLFLDAEEFTSYLFISKSPVISVDSIQYYDATNTLQTLSTNAYEVSLNDDPCRIKVNTMPQIYNRLEAVCITFTCGYAANVGNATLCTAADIATNTLTKNAHNLTKGTPLFITDAGTITGIETNTTYYALPVTANTFKITQTPGGTAINLTGDNTTPPTYQQFAAIPPMLTAAIKLIFGHLYEHREDVVIGTILAELKNGSSSLLDMYKQHSYYPMPLNNNNI